MSDKKKSSLFNIIELGKRSWYFFQQDNLLGTLLIAFSLVFGKWYFVPDDLSLEALKIIAFAMIGITGWKYFFEYMERNQALKEAQINGLLEKQKVETAKQVQIAVEMASLSWENSRNNIASLIDYLKVSETPDPKVIEMQMKIIDESMKLGAEKISAIDMPHKEFVVKYIASAELIEEQPTLENLPTIEKEVVDEMIKQLQEEELISSNDVNDKTKGIKDYHPDTKES